MIEGVGAEGLGGGVLDDGDDLLRHLQALVEHIHNGLTHHGVQGQDHQHGQQAPQAAAAHGDALFFIKGLDGGILTLGIIGVAALDLLHLGLQPGHFHHAFLGLGRHGQQHQLHHDGKNDQGKAIAAGELIQPVQQVAEGHLNDIGNGERKEHGLSSLFFGSHGTGS